MHNVTRTADAVAIEAGQIPRLIRWLEAQDWSDFAQSLAAEYARLGSLTPLQLSAAARMRSKSTASKAARMTQKGFARREPEVGFYQAGSAVYKVQENRTKTARYAKVLCDDGSWAYVGKNPFSLLQPSDRLTRESAAAHGRLTGRCVCCGRTLTNPDSVAAGIGPICAQHF